MSAVPPESPAHLGALTGIRGIAAWMVVLYHVRKSLILLLPADAIAVFAKGYLAVDLFFMLSGFVLWYSYADRFRQHGLTFAAPFLWRRLARIWPLHLFILAVLIPFALLLRAEGGNMLHYPFGELPLHVLLIQNWGMTQEISWNQPAWSISTELAAYLLFPLTVCLARWERLPAPVLLGAAVLLLAGLHVLFAVNGHGTLGAAIETLGLWRCLIEFSAGNLLCILWQRWRGSRIAAPAAAAVALAALAAGALFALPETAFVPLAFASGLLALALGRGPLVRFLGRGGMLYLGEISYSTYLSHFLLFILYKLVFVDASLQLGWAGLAGFLALVALSSVALYHGVEKPAQRWFNRNVPRWPKRAETVAAE